MLYSFYLLLGVLKCVVMKLKEIYIIPLIGLGWYKEIEEIQYMGTYKYINIVVLCVKIRLMKRLDVHDLQL